MKIKKPVKIAIWAISIVIILGALLFAAFLVSENSQPAEQAESQQGNQTQASEPQPGQCEFKLEEPNVSGSFECNDITWTIEEEEGSILYTTPLRFTDRGNFPDVRTDYALRNNPLKINSISSNITKLPSEITYVSYDSSMSKCNNTMLGAIQTGYFLGLMGINATGTVTEDEENRGVEAKTCDDASENVTVIVIQSKETCEPKITEYGNCIVMDMAKCYPAEVAEKLILDFIRLGIEQGKIEAE